MRQLAYLATVVALVAVQPALADQSRAAARGRALAQSQCAACHAVNETGASPNPKSPTFRDIAGIYEEHSLQKKLTEIEETGHYDMPSIRIHSNQIGDLVAYFNRLNRASR